MEKKFKLTEEETMVGGLTLYRIEALRDFSDVKRGDKGGWIQKESNLSQADNCWIYDEAMAFEDARVIDNAKIKDSARVFDDAIISDDAYIGGDVRICKNAMIADNAKVYDNVWILGSAYVHGNAKIYGNVKILDTPFIGGDAQIYENAQIEGNAHIYDNAKIYGNSKIRGHCRICKDACVGGHAEVLGLSELTRGEITSTPLQIKGSLYFVNIEGDDKLRIGCQVYSIEEWEKHYRQIGLAERFSEKEITEYKLYIDLAKNILNNNK